MSPLATHSQQVGEALAGKRPPVSQNDRAQMLGLGGFASNVPSVEQPEQRPQVLRRDPSGLRDGAYGMVQPDP